MYAPSWPKLIPCLCKLSWKFQPIQILINTHAQTHTQIFFKMMITFETAELKPSLIHSFIHLLIHSFICSCIKHLKTMKEQNHEKLL